MISKILEAQRHSATGEAPATAREPRHADPLRQPLAPRPKRQAWAGLLGWLVVAGIAGAAYYYVPLETWKSLLAKVMPAPAAAPEVKGPRVVPVVTSPARKGDMDIYLNGLGTVTALYTVTLHTRVDGELVHVGFTEGQMVKKGDLLAEIDPRPFQVQLKQAQGNRTKDQAARADIAKLDMERYKSMFKVKQATQQQIDAQVALIKQSEGAIETDDGMIASANLQLKYCRIIAPISGRIGLRMVDPGNIVHANDLTGLAVITQLQPITVIFTIPQDDIGRVQQRVNTVPVEVEVYDRDFRNHLATGKLMALDNQVDATTGTVRLKAMFENKDNLLFPNQFVNARLLIGSQRDVVIVPTASVQHGPESTFVYVVEGSSDADLTVSLRKVTIGPTEGDQVVIATGLTAGDAVVVDGIDKLQPGTKVAVRGSGVGAAPGPKADRAPGDERTPAAADKSADNRSPSQTSP